MTVVFLARVTKEKAEGHFNLRLSVIIKQLMLKGDVVYVTLSCILIIHTCSYIGSIDVMNDHE